MGATVLLTLVLQVAVPALPSATGTVLHVSGSVSHPLSLSLPDLAAMPRTTVHLQEHGKAVTYEGVTLTAILQKAGAPLGSQMHGKSLATYVLITASDGYRVVFALPELDPDFTDKAQQIILADTADGKPLPEKQGPIRVIAPTEKRAALWIRMVEKIDVVTAP